MKIAYSHLVQHIEENPSMEHLSDILFQLGHEHEIEDGIFDMEFTQIEEIVCLLMGFLEI